MYELNDDEGTIVTVKINLKLDCLMKFKRKLLAYIYRLFKAFPLNLISVQRSP